MRNHPANKRAQSRPRPPQNSIEFQPAYRVRLNEADKKKAGQQRAGTAIEFGLALLFAGVLGMLGVFAAPPDDHSLKDFILTIITLKTVVFAVAAFIYILAPFDKSCHRAYQFCARGIVLSILFVIVGISAYLHGVSNANASPYALAAKAWLEKINSESSRLDEAFEAFKSAESELNSCARQRAALNIQLRVLTELRGRLAHQSKFDDDLTDFCKSERHRMETTYNQLKNIRSSIEVILLDQPRYPHPET